MDNGTQDPNVPGQGTGMPADPAATPAPQVDPMGAPAAPAQDPMGTPTPAPTEPAATPEMPGQAPVDQGTGMPGGTPTEGDAGQGGMPGGAPAA